MNINKSASTIFVLIILIILSFFHFRGITYYDEGYILNSALRVTSGEIPYKDFDMVYTPISFLFTSGFFRIFGESIFSGRLAALSISTLSIIGIYLIIKLFTKNNFIIFGSILFFISWGPTHINFPWPTMFALCFLLYSAYFYLLGILNDVNKYLFIAGNMSALVFLSKQNFGVGVIVVFLLAFLFINSKNKTKQIINYISGVFSVLIGYTVFLVISSSFLPFIQNMHLYTLKRVFVDKSIETPFLYEGTIFARIVKTFFYTSPLIFALASIRIIPKQKRIFVLLPVLTSVFYLLGIRPTTDYVHAVSLLALSCLPLTLISVYAKTKQIRYTAIIILVSMTLLGFYTAYFKGYYQWEPSLDETSTFVSNNRAGIYLTAEQANNTDKLISYIQSSTNQNEYIYVNAYEPMVYFLAARRNPTPYDLISANQLPLSYQQGIIKCIQAKNVKLVLMHELNINEKSIVSDFVRKNYKKTKIIDGFIIFEK